MKYISLLASVALILVGTQAFAATNTVADTSWELTTYNGESATGSLSFTADTAFSKFCNNVSQKYTLSEDGKTITSDGNGISTMMYCEGLPMTLENNFKFE